MSRSYGENVPTAVIKLLYILPPETWLAGVDVSLQLYKKAAITTVL